MTRRAVKMYRGLGQRELDALLRTGFMERQPGNEAIGLYLRLRTVCRCVVLKTHFAGISTLRPRRMR